MRKKQKNNIIPVAKKTVTNSQLTRQASKEALSNSRSKSKIKDNVKSQSPQEHVQIAISTRRGGHSSVSKEKSSSKYIKTENNINSSTLQRNRIKSPIETKSRDSRGKLQASTAKGKNSVKIEENEKLKSSTKASKHNVSVKVSEASGRATLAEYSSSVRTRANQTNTPMKRKADVKKK